MNKKLGNIFFEEVISITNSKKMLLQFDGDFCYCAGTGCNEKYCDPNDCGCVYANKDTCGQK